MTTEELKALWFKYYGENLETEYSGFYKKMVDLEKSERENNNDN